MKLIIIGVLAGAVLAESLRLLYLTTGINSYNLLFNFDYVPFICMYSDTAGLTGMAFHYITCMWSGIVSYYILQHVLIFIIYYLTLIMYHLLVCILILPDGQAWRFIT